MFSLSTATLHGLPMPLGRDPVCCYLCRWSKAIGRHTGGDRWRADRVVQGAV